MRRRRWTLNQGRCSGCLAGTEALEAAHRSARLAALRPGVTAADARIERLAAKRAARSTGGGR